LVVVTLALAFATGFLWWATRALVKGAEITGERQLRAYVLVTEGSIESFDTERPISVVMTIKNTGQTPAYDYAFTGIIDVGKIPRTEFKWGTPAELDLVSKSTIGPGIEVSTGRALTRTLEKKAYDQIMEKKLGVYIFGQLTYRDAFDKARWSNFRYIVTWRPDGSGVGLAPLSEGNDSN
jgi:hypothetical protein